MDFGLTHKLILIIITSGFVYFKGHSQNTDSVGFIFWAPRHVSVEGGLSKDDLKKFGVMSKVSITQASEIEQLLAKKSQLLRPSESLIMDDFRLVLKYSINNELRVIYSDHFADVLIDEVLYEDVDLGFEYNLGKIMNYTLLYDQYTRSKSYKYRKRLDER